MRTKGRAEVKQIIAERESIKVTPYQTSLMFVKKQFVCALLA